MEAKKHYIDGDDVVDDFDDEMMQYNNDNVDYTSGDWENIIKNCEHANDNDDGDVKNTNHDSNS